MQPGISSSLFTGLKVTFVKQMVSWTSFLYFDYKYKFMFRDMRGLEESQPLSYSDLAVIAVLTGMSNIFLGIFHSFLL